MLANVPTTVTPPLVPTGTCRHVVTKRGFLENTEPISEAHVSPLLHAEDPSKAMENIEALKSQAKSMGRSPQPTSTR